MSIWQYFNFWSADQEISWCKNLQNLSITEDHDSQEQGYMCLPLHTPEYFLFFFKYVFCFWKFCILLHPKCCGIVHRDFAVLCQTQQTQKKATLLLRNPMETFPSVSNPKIFSGCRQANSLRKRKVKKGRL